MRAKNKPSGVLEVYCADGRGIRFPPDWNFSLLSDRGYTAWSTTTGAELSLNIDGLDFDGLQKIQRELEGMGVQVTPLPPPLPH